MKSQMLYNGSVSRDQKRKIRIKGYQELHQMAESDPDLNDLNQANLLDNFYPNQLLSKSASCPQSCLSV